MTKVLAKTLPQVPDLNRLILRWALPRPSDLEPAMPAPPAPGTPAPVSKRQPAPVLDQPEWSGCPARRRGFPSLACLSWKRAESSIC